jgi:hypothetical protein
MLAREDFASELFGSQHRVTGITGDSLVGYSAPYKAAHRIFVHPLFHSTSLTVAASRSFACGVLYRTALFSAAPQ